METSKLLEFGLKLGAPAVAELQSLPVHMQGAVVDYILFGYPVGDFLFAVLSNDFVHAWGRADSDNDRAMKQWASFLYNAMPSHPVRSWGSKEIVKAWQEIGGLYGMERKRTEEKSGE